MSVDLPDQITPDAVADYLVASLGDDPAGRKLLDANATAKLPNIDVDPMLGRLLMILAKSIGATHILEIGTLGGYSTLWLARALPAGGQIVTLEVDARHAAVARDNLDRALSGNGPSIDIRLGPALAALTAMVESATTSDALFDMVFIDADKRNNAAYVDHALRLSRSGALIIVDNMVRAGDLVGGDDPQSAGCRAVLDQFANDPRLDMTVMQTTGAKGWDGLMIARVR